VSDDAPPTMADIVEPEVPEAEPEAPASDDPPRPFSFRTNTAVYILSGPAGPELDRLVATAVPLHLEVSPTGDGRYRLAGASATIIPYAAWISERCAPHVCEIERPSGVVFNLRRAAPLRAARRIEVVGDAGAYEHVRRAIDHGLEVTPGMNVWRFSVTGKTSALVRWAAACLKVDAAEAMRRLALDQATIDREDAIADDPATVRVEVALPTRRTTTDITRSATGDIVNVVQRETSEP
jgi:hypothetical protein